jgi:hypothetical protein
MSGRFNVICSRQIHPSGEERTELKFCWRLQYSTQPPVQVGERVHVSGDSLSAPQSRPEPAVPQRWLLPVTELTFQPHLLPRATAKIRTARHCLAPARSGQGRSTP